MFLAASCTESNRAKAAELLTCQIRVHIQDPHLRVEHLAPFKTELLATAAAMVEVQRLGEEVSFIAGSKQTNTKLEVLQIAKARIETGIAGKGAVRVCEW